MPNAKSIRDMREMVGIKQIELARKAGIDRSRLSTAENGHIQLRLDEMAAIRKALASIAQQKAKQLEKLSEMVL